MFKIVTKELSKQSIYVKPLKKPVDTLAIVPTVENLSILSRKIYNVMMHYAQAQGDGQIIYKVKLKDIINCIDFNSQNTEVIKAHLRQMVTTKVEWQSPTKSDCGQWAVSTLISMAKLEMENNEIVMQWCYSPVIQKEILDPQRYARISLAIQSKFKSMPGLALYEICCRYIDNPSGLTARQHWTWWRPVLTGLPNSHVGVYKEWKYFKRDVIKKAVNEVNQITDLDVTVIEHSGLGRSVGDLQFSIKRKNQEQFVKSIKKIEPINLNDIGRAINAGIPQNKAETLLCKYGEQKFTESLDALEKRLQRNDMDKVTNSFNYLKTIISGLEQNKKQSVDPVKIVKHINKKRIEIIELYRNWKRQESNALFQELLQDDQLKILKSFESIIILSISSTVQETYKKRGLIAPMIKSLFSKFLTDHFFGKGWESPSDTDLLDFSIANNYDEK